MEPASRTPEGEPNRCPVCGHQVRIEPSRPPGDAPCEYCGHLLWFSDSRNVEGVATDREPSGRLTRPPLGERGQMTQSDPATKAVTGPPIADWAKATLVAAVVGLVIGTVSVAGVSDGVEDVPVVARMCMVAASCLVSMLAALGLSLRDVLCQRMRQGQQVSWSLRLYFTSGWVSMAAWIVTAIGMPLVIAGCLALANAISDQWSVLVGTMMA